MRNKIFTVILILIFIVLLIIINNILKNKSREVNYIEEESNMDIMQVTSNNFEEEVLKSERKVLIDFYADWCGPCQMLSPTVEEIASENEDLKVVRVNIDDEVELATQYGIISIPTLVVIKNGQEIDRAVGVVPKYSIVEMINK